MATCEDCVTALQRLEDRLTNTPNRMPYTTLHETTCTRSHHSSIVPRKPYILRNHMYKTQLKSAKVQARTTSFLSTPHRLGLVPSEADHSRGRELSYKHNLLPVIFRVQGTAMLDTSGSGALCASVVAPKTRRAFVCLSANATEAYGNMSYSSY